MATLMQRAAGLRHEMAWILLGQGLSFAGGFIGIKVLTTIMGPAGYGKLALGLTIAGILTTFIYGPLANVVSRFYSIYRERGELSVYFAVLKRTHCVAAVILSVLSLVAAGIATWRVGGEWALIITLALFFGIASGINTSYIALQSAIRQRNVVALHQGADVWLRIGLSIALLALFSKSSCFALLGYLLGTITVTLSQNVFALRNREIRSAWGKECAGVQQRACSREFMVYASPFVAWAGIAYVSAYGDRWILQYLFGAREVGIYAALFQIANSPIAQLTTMINQLMVPIIYERAGSLSLEEQVRSSARLLRMVVLVTSAVLALVTLAMYLFSEALVRLLTSQAFIEHHHLLWIITAGLALLHTGQMLTTKGMYANKPQIYLWPKILQAASFILFSLFLCARFGVSGVAISLCVSSLVHLLMIVMINRRLEVIPVTVS